MIVPSQGLVLITGVNGYLGSHIATELLKRGYRVRGTVRSPEKAALIHGALSEHNLSGLFEYAIVPDVTAELAWDEAIRGVDGIVHVATDTSFDADPNKVITPMVQSVRKLLEAAASEPSVKRFVLTSSDRALYDPIVNTKGTLDRDMWNEWAVEKAWEPVAASVEQAWIVYAALKTQCEQELWRFNKEHKPSFVINSVLPAFTVGPLVYKQQQGSTGRMVLDSWDSSGQSATMRDFGASWFIDAQDIALLHIAGLVLDDVKEERLLGFTAPFNFNSWLEVFRELDPQRSWPRDDSSQPHNLWTLDTSRELSLLHRLGKDDWTKFHDSVRRLVFESKV